MVPGLNGEPHNWGVISNECGDYEWLSVIIQITCGAPQSPF
jgi:hypothetical protein